MVKVDRQGFVTVGGVQERQTFEAQIVRANAYLIVNSDMCYFSKRYAHLDGLNKCDHLASLS